MEGAKKGSFWSSTAAIITAVGTLLAALAAVATFLVGQRLFVGTSPDGAPDDGGSGGGPAGAQGQKFDEQVMWSSELLLTSQLDFDQPGGPERNPETLGTDTYLWLEDRISSPYGMVKWPGGKPPGQADCAMLLASHGVSDRFVFDVNDRFCVKTTAGRVAMLHVLEDVPQGWRMQGTVWKQRLNAG